MVFKVRVLKMIAAIHYGKQILMVLVSYMEIVQD